MDIPIFEQRVLQFVRQRQLIDHNDHVLVAVSAGPDSVALLHALVALQNDLGIARLTVVHFNHQLRGHSAAQDHDFVLALAKRLGLSFCAAQQDVRACQKDHGGSLEMAARACRHSFFREAMLTNAAQKVALGHTANDQAEELLLRLMRGTGPSGMAGMAAGTEQGIIRPLLFAGRVEVMEYLKARQLDFRLDASNLEPTCQRNVLRLEMFPRLEKHFHRQITQTLCRHASLAQEEESYWKQQVERIWSGVCSEEAQTRISLRLAGLSTLHPVLLKRVLREAVKRLKGSTLGFYAVHWVLLHEWSTQPGSGKFLQLPRRLCAYKEADTLIIATEALHAPAPLLEGISELGSHDFGVFRLNLSCIRRNSSDAPPAEPNIAWMDADRVNWPLTTRWWQPGDRFQPLGLAGSKKLQDYFTDCRISRSRRGRIPLLCDRLKICWIMGQRLDHRVRITPETKQILVAEYQPSE